MLLLENNYVRIITYPRRNIYQHKHKIPKISQATAKRDCAQIDNQIHY